MSKWHYTIGVAGLGFYDVENDSYPTGKELCRHLNDLQQQLDACKESKEVMHQNMLTVVGAGVGIKQQLEKLEEENAKLKKALIDNWADDIDSLRELVGDEYSDAELSGAAGEGE